MSNLYKDLVKLAGSEQVEKVVIGPYGEEEWEVLDGPKPEYVGKLLSLEQAKTILDYEYCSADEYSSADSHPFFAWTKSKVIFVHMYEGMASVVYVPRNPIACEPEYSYMTSRGERQ